MRRHIGFAGCRSRPELRCVSPATRPSPRPRRAPNRQSHGMAAAVAAWAAAAGGMAALVPESLSRQDLCPEFGCQPDGVSSCQPDGGNRIRVPRHKGVATSEPPSHFVRATPLERSLQLGNNRCRHHDGTRQGARRWLRSRTVCRVSGDGHGLYRSSRSFSGPAFVNRGEPRDIGREAKLSR